MFPQKNTTFKKLTLLVFLAVFSMSSVAQVVSIQNLKGYFRILIRSNKSDIQVNRSMSGLKINTINKDLFVQIKKELVTLKLNSTFIKSVNFSDDTNKGQINVVFSTPNVVFFNFYRDREKSSIIDIWSEKVEKIVEVSQVKQTAVLKKLSQAQKVKLPKTLAKAIAKQKKLPVKKIVSNTKLSDTELFKNTKNYRDFRYGAPFIWNYRALAPSMKSVIRLDRKTAEFFYPVRDRNYEKNDQEAHLQLVINLYRKKKWGLMYKAMKLFSKKYGENTESDFIEYLKANALLKDNLLNKQDPKMLKNVINMYGALAERVTDYELKRSLMKFLIQYHIEDQNYIASLALAKRLYVIVQKNFDIEESPYAVDVILISLAKLHQIKKIEKLVSDKTVVKIIPKVRLASFKIFALVQIGKVEKAIEYYQKVKKTLPVAESPSILFNMAESYFRVAKFKKSVKLYDKFITYYSVHNKSSASRLRIALIYDLLEKSPKVVSELYKNAINHSTLDEISVEAKIRYVAFRKIRKKVLTIDDRNTAFLLKFKESPRVMNENLKKMLWLVRLRSFIVDKEYLKALSYLNAIPVSSLAPSERRTFNGDGAEVVLGIIQESYKQSNYSKIIRLWEIYKAKYVNKVALDPYINYIVGKSYINLGLYDSFDRFHSTFSAKKASPIRQFPKWIKRLVHSSSERLLDELVVIKNMQLKNWDEARKSLKILATTNSRKNFYRGIILFNNKNYKGAIRSFEKYFARNSEERVDNADDMAHMVNAYMKSIYHLGDMEKYEKVGRALISDLNKTKKSNLFLESVKEEISYMLIENDFSLERYLQLAKTIKTFQSRYKKSLYQARMNYLLGVSLVRTQKESEGEAIFEQIINNKDVPEYLKELSKTELSLIKIKNKLI